MIRFIAAVDEKNGMADERGIPWQGKIPGEVAYFRKQTMNGVVLMGYATYEEFDKPLHGRQNFVANVESVELRPGFKLVTDARDFLKNNHDEVWVIGGPGLFASTLELAKEIFITRVKGDYNCTKFFPKFEDKFVLKSESESVSENGITYRFQVWVKK
jgi:dihydrofolate reductase